MDLSTIITPLRDSLDGLDFAETEWRDLAESIVRPRRPAIRLRAAQQSEALPFSTEPVAWHPRGRWLSPDARPGARLNYAAGDYYIQDAGSLLALALLDARPGEVVCDLCAAPGGKSTAILEDLGTEGWLLANEPIRARLPALELNLARHGSPRFAVSQLDPERLADHLEATFDAVLVDAPCSGQTLLGRGKQTVASLSSKQIEHCAARQRRILEAAARLVRPGGRLVYSTCTFAVAENEGQVEPFLDTHPSWRMEPAAALAAWQSPRLEGTYRLWPHRDGCAGAFAAQLRRSDEVETAIPPNHPSRPRQRPPREQSRLPDDFAAWGELTRVAVWTERLRCFAWPDNIPLPLMEVAASGPEVAFRKGATWFPSYALAMRRDERWQPAHIVILDEATAAQFVRGEALAMDIRGWTVAHWHGRPLGWLKGDGRLARNHLPKPARSKILTPATSSLFFLANFVDSWQWVLR